MSSAAIEAHPHDLQVGEPEPIDAVTLRRLSTIDDTRALAAVGLEWLAIALAAALFVTYPAWWLYLPIALFIGARQHALTVIGHDASHYRFLNNRALNDHLGNVLVQWPVFISVEGFRKYHGAHHRHLGVEGDGNRFLWKTHDAEGALNPEWQYPKTLPQLIGVLAYRGLFFTGMRWILRGLIGGVVVRRSWAWVAARMAYYAAIAAVVTWAGAWSWFLLLWVVPFCTWHIVCQYMRLIAEHSAISAELPLYEATRTTVPTALERLFILPRNIGYHIEHHWYPGVPFYNLPELHDTLMQSERFASNAVVSHSLMSSLAAVTTAQQESP